MRITCPHCGNRSLDEFVYLGDASVERPDPARPDALSAFVEYVYQRDNPAGRFRELWYHNAGCHAWLVLTRDTKTHEIFAVETAQEARQSARQTNGAA